MKKVLLAVALIATVGLLAGCNSNTSGGFDDADTAAFDQANTGPTDDVGNPPVPPEPEIAE